MSVLKMSEVWKMDLPPNEKLVAMMLADRCDEQGEQVYYSVRTIAAACSMTDRNVQLILSKLLAKGVLEVRARASRYKPTRYRLITDQAEMSVIAERNKSELAERKRVDASRKRKVRGEADFTHAEPSPMGEAHFTQTAESMGEAGFTHEAIRGEAGFVSGVKPTSPDPYRDPKEKILKPCVAVAPRADAPSHTTVAPEPARKPKPLATQLLEEFDALHQAEFNGEKATITSGKDAKILLGLVEKHGVDVVRARMAMFFRDEKLRGDTWINSRGYTVAMFRNVFGRFAIRTRAVGMSAPSEADAHLDAAIHQQRQQREETSQRLAVEILNAMPDGDRAKLLSEARADLRARFKHMDINDDVASARAVLIIRDMHRGEDRLRSALSDYQQRRQGAA